MANTLALFKNIVQAVGGSVRRRFRLHWSDTEEGFLLDKDVGGVPLRWKDSDE